jgi:uncharacterized protein (TIGR02391 family)
MFTKTQLKNMFLLLLEQHSFPNSHLSYGADTLIPNLNNGDLSKEEIVLSWEGYEELKREGIIMQNPKINHSSMFNVITSDGQDYLKELKQKGVEFKRPKLFLKDIVSDQRLLDSCKTEFDTMRYWNAVSNAQRHLEIRVREKSGINSTGFDLMSKAFDKDHGKINILASQDQEEKEGFKLIMMGVMKFHRNQKAHNEGELTIETAYKIIGYVDYLLKIIEQARIR